MVSDVETIQRRDGSTYSSWISVFGRDNRTSSEGPYLGKPQRKKKGPPNNQTIGTRDDLQMRPRFPFPSSSRHTTIGQAIASQPHPNKLQTYLQCAAVASKSGSRRSSVSLDNEPQRRR